MEWQHADGTCGSDSDGSLPPVLSGDVFADGHCTRNVNSDMDRATWALVQVNADGDAMAWIRGTVPGTYQQTPQSGEFVAALHAIRLTSDCTLLDN